MDGPRSLWHKSGRYRKLAVKRRSGGESLGRETPKPRMCVGRNRDHPWSYRYYEITPSTKPIAGHRWSDRCHFPRARRYDQSGSDASHKALSGQWRHEARSEYCHVNLRAHFTSPCTIPAQDWKARRMSAEADRARSPPVFSCPQVPGDPWGRLPSDP